MRTVSRACPELMQLLSPKAFTLYVSDASILLPKREAPNVSEPAALTLQLHPKPVMRMAKLYSWNSCRQLLEIIGLFALTVLSEPFWGTSSSLSQVWSSRLLVNAVLLKCSPQGITWCECGTPEASRITNLKVPLPLVAIVSDTSPLPQNDVGTSLGLHIYSYPVLEACWSRLESLDGGLASFHPTTRKYQYTHTNRCICNHTYTYEHTRTYVYMYIYMYVYKNKQTYIHTYTNAFTSDVVLRINSR